jgi:hypothetical protein
MSWLFLNKKQIKRKLMSIMLHPSKTTPKRFRVQDKVLGIQKYFSLNKKREADLFWQECLEKRKYRNLRQELPINQIFNKDGSVKGLKRKVRNRSDRPSYECFEIQLSTTSGQKKTEITLTHKQFEVAYKQAQDKILSMLVIDRTYEITKMFNETKRLYW